VGMNRQQEELALKVMSEPNCRCRPVPFFDDKVMDTPKEAFDKEKEKSGVKFEDGKWTFGGAGVEGAGERDGFARGISPNPATSTEFNEAKKQVPDDRKVFLSTYTEDELKQNGIKLFLSENKKSGYGLKGDEIINVFSVEKGAGEKVMLDAIKKGGLKLDCFDKRPDQARGLPDYYAKFGFKEYKREKNWTPGEPDVVYMKR